MTSQTLTLSKFNFALSNRLLISLGILLWLYYVISQIPATWAAYALTRTGDVAMSGVSGTIWAGRASLVSVKIKEVDRSIGQLSWDMNMLSFLTLKPCAKVNAEMDSQQFGGNVCVAGKNSFMIKDASANFPAGLLQGLTPINIDGQFSLNITKLEMANGQLGALAAKVTWMGAKVFNGTNWMALGNLGADLADDTKKGLSAHIVDVQSPMQIDLNGSLPFPSGTKIKGSIKMPEPYAREINAAAWMSMFAAAQPADAEGNIVYAVDLNY